MFFALALAAAAAGAAADAAQSQSSIPSPVGREIIVTGRRLDDLEANLKRCRERRCPPNEEIDAALGLAEFHFERGDYRKARGTIRDAIGRNRQHARRYPYPVSDLYRSLSRVTRHMGEDEESVRSAYEIGRVLEEGLGTRHKHALDARYEFVDALLGTRTTGMDSALRDFERDAKRAGRADLAARARLKMLWIEYLRRPYGGTLAELNKLAMSTARDDRIASIGATVLLATIHRRSGDHKTADALMARIGPVRASERVLLYAPGYQVYERDIPPGSSSTTSSLYNDQVWDRTYMDVSFWIRADGRVRDVEVVRAGARPEWADPVLNSIRGRRYSQSADGSDTFKLERYTYTARKVALTGTRVKVRSLDDRIEMLDLTKGAPQASASAAQKQ